MLRPLGSSRVPRPLRGETMTSKERMLLALRREVPDRVPATVHQWQPAHLDRFLDGIDAREAFRRFRLDASITYCPLIECESPDWRVEEATSSGPEDRRIRNLAITTPGGTLTQTLVQHPTTTWTTDYLVKRPEDIELFERYMPVPRLDRAALAREYDRLGDDGIMRGSVWGNQGGCWQDACALYGLQNMILAAHHGSTWVHRFLRILQEKKLRFIDQSLSGARYDLIETGGGAGSSTCISPDLHRQFCVPYDREQHDAIHQIGFPVVYHTCGGMMPILEAIVENGCDASETLTPAGIGGDARHAEIKRRIGDRVCLIGGLDQFQILECGTPEQIRAEVFRLFQELGGGGGYIMSPSDHFFEAPPENLRVYAEAAWECVYH